MSLDSGLEVKSNQERFLSREVTRTSKLVFRKTDGGKNGLESQISVEAAAQERW